MSETSALRLKAEYNHWMNQRLYAVCAAMSDEERRKDLGAFFRSIHGTLNHLLLVDRLWLARLRAEPVTPLSLAQELYSDFAELQRERDITDHTIKAYIATVSSASLNSPMTYTNSKGQLKTLPLGLVLTHFFNHQTHHRGQVTALVTRLGYDVGDTDIIFMPEAARFYSEQD